MKVEVFLSYAEEDRPLAAQLAALLEGHGWSLWWDRKIPPGKTWRQTIEEAISGMDCMVVLWSAHSIDSPWVQEEAEEGLARGRLLPVLIDDVRPPMGFRSIQACDLRQRPGELASAPGYEVLLAAIEARVGAGARGPAMCTSGPLPPPPSAQPAQPALSDRKSSRRGASWLLGAAATVVAAGLVYLALPTPSLREPVAPASQPTAAGGSAAAQPTTASGTPSTSGGSRSSTNGDAVATTGRTASTTAADAAQSAPASPPAAARPAPARPTRLSAYCQAIRDRRDIGDPVLPSDLKECRL